MSVDCDGCSPISYDWYYNCAYNKLVDMLRFEDLKYGRCVVLAKTRNANLGGFSHQNCRKYDLVGAISSRKDPHFYSATQEEVEIQC